MHSRFFASMRSRPRVLAGLVGGGLLLWLSLALLDAHQDLGIGFALGSLGGRNTTVERLLEKGAQGRLGKSVKLRGRVIGRSPLLDGVVYQIEDRTGSIWVESNDTQVELGQVLIVQGKPQYQAAVVDGLDFGGFYLAEQRRRVSKAV